MNKKEFKKRTIIVGTSGKLATDMRKFLEQRFDVIEIPFNVLLDKGKSLNLIVYGGGPDITPAYYGEEAVGANTVSDEKLDKEALQIFENYIHVPKLGICRGAQFLTVANGGKLIQHVEGHTEPHDIDIHFEGKNHPTTFKMTSTHHQMMFPFNIRKRDYQILGWASKYRSSIYLNGNNKPTSLPAKFVEPEIVFYHRTRSLAIQGHPEHNDCNKQTQELCLNLIEDYLV